MFSLFLAALVVPLPLECVLLTVHIGFQVADTHLLRRLGLDGFDCLGFYYRGIWSRGFRG